MFRYEVLPASADRLPRGMARGQMPRNIVGMSDAQLATIGRLRERLADASGASLTTPESGAS